METQAYAKASYTVSIKVEKSLQDVFNHLIYDVSKYWPEEFEGESTKLNGEFVFRTGDSHYSKNKVVELVPNKKMVWLVTESIRKTDNFDWTGTKMIFELTPKGDNTEVKFTYDGIILENEYERLVQVCDMVIKDLLYSFLASAENKKEDKSFKTTIEVSKPPQEVFNAIKEVSKWWSKDFEGNSSKLNDEFIICHPGRHFSRQKLVEVVPNKRIVWLVTDSVLDWLEKDQHEWTNTRMIFEISPNGGKTIIYFSHEGLIPEKECYERCQQGWDMVIKERLFDYIVDGKTI